MHEDNGILGKARKREKLENPARVAELKPEETLRQIGVRPGQTLCDIGAGSGLFSLAAARLGVRTVWALDTDDAILEDLRSRAAAVPNLQNRLGRWRFLSSCAPVRRLGPAGDCTP